MILPYNITQQLILTTLFIKQQKLSVDVLSIKMYFKVQKKVIQINSDQLNSLHINIIMLEEAKKTDSNLIILVKLLPDHPSCYLQKLTDGRYNQHSFLNVLNALDGIVLLDLFLDST